MAQYYVCQGCGAVYGADELNKDKHDCWVCGDELVEAGECDGCGDIVPESHLFGGYCEDCLRDSINELTAERYLSGRGYLVQFLANYVWDAEISGGNDRFHAMCLTEFVNNYRTYHAQVVQFIMDDSGRSGMDDYGVWFSNYRRKSRSGRERPA